MEHYSKVLLQYLYKKITIATVSKALFITLFTKCFRGGILYTHDMKVDTRKYNYY